MSLGSAMPSIKSKKLELIFDIPIAKTQKFWEGLKEGKFCATKCKNCGAVYFPPAADCHNCLSSDMEWIEVAKEGEVTAFTHVIVRPKSFMDKPPYTVAIAQMKDGVKILAWLKEAKMTEVKVGMKVKLEPAIDDEGNPTYYFKPLKQ